MIDLEGKDARKLKDILDGLKSENDKYEENCKKEVYLYYIYLNRLGDAVLDEEDKIDHESFKKS